MNPRTKINLINIMTIKQYLVSFLLLSVLISSCTNQNGSNEDIPIELSIREEIIETEREAVLKRADKMLSQSPVTVTDTFCIRSAGGSHDYYSEGTYWWQNPEDPDGKAQEFLLLQGGQRLTAKRK